jgi:hypothetical protein
MGFDTTNHGINNLNKKSPQVAFATCGLIFLALLLFEVFTMLLDKFL